MNYIAVPKLPPYSKFVFKNSTATQLVKKFPISGTYNVIIFLTTA